MKKATEKAYLFSREELWFTSASQLVKPSDLGNRFPNSNEKTFHTHSPDSWKFYIINTYMMKKTKKQDGPNKPASSHIDWTESKSKKQSEDYKHFVHHRVIQSGPSEGGRGTPRRPL